MIESHRLRPFFMMGNILQITTCIIRGNSILEECMKCGQSSVCIGFTVDDNTLPGTKRPRECSLGLNGLRDDVHYFCAAIMLSPMWMYQIRWDSSHVIQLHMYKYGDEARIKNTCALVKRPQFNYTLGKKGCYTPLKTIKPMWIEHLCFHLAEIGMIWTRDCIPTKSDTTLGRRSMQGQVGSSSSETTV